MSETKELLRTLDRLVGTWTVGGESTGTVRYGWMGGGNFLVQHVDLVHDDEATSGVEYIGVDKNDGRLRSHYFGSPGEILEVVYELEGDVRTIWFGAVVSPASLVGTFGARPGRCARPTRPGLPP